MPADSPDHELPPPRKSLSEEERADLLNEMLERHASQLSEHFSSVQIVATKLEEDGGTRYFNKGSGDRYARYGAARRYVRESKEG